MQDDVVIVGAGLAGCVCANLLAQMGNHVLIIEKRNHIGGNCFDYYNDDGILIHKYGIHCFHTNNERVWNYISSFTDWHYYQHRVLSYIDGEYLVFPRDAKQQCYTGYENKQWGSYAHKLDGSVRRRVTQHDDARYFKDKYQGIPRHGHTRMFERMLDSPNISVMLQTDYRDVHDMADHLIFTGMIDQWFGYKLGVLPYRSLRFEHDTLDMQYYQEAAQVNYPVDYAFTRVIEIKHATGQKHDKTTIVREYPTDQGEPYYPIPCEETERLARQYRELNKNPNVHFIGRLATYRYLNMDEVVSDALDLVDRIC